MDNSVPMELETYFFTKLELKSNLDFVNKPDISFQFNSESKLSIHPHVEDRTQWRAILQISITQKEEQPLPYYAALEVVGFFKTPNEIDIDKSSRIIQIQGGALLYTASREMLLMLMSRGPWPPIILPTTNFLCELQKENIEESSAESPEEKVQTD